MCFFWSETDSHFGSADVVFKCKWWGVWFKKAKTAPGQISLQLFKGSSLSLLALFSLNVSGTEVTGEVRHHPSEYGEGPTSEEAPHLSRGLGRAGLLSGD